MFARSLPNLLGLFRIVSTPFLVWLILIDRPNTYLWAVVLILVMAISDMLDGRIARHLQAVSPLGIFLDTISDKIFVAGALLPMVERALLPSWIVLLVIARDFLISGLRSYAAAEGKVIAAGKWGKQKLVITVIALVWRLLAASAETGGAIGAWGGGAMLALLSLWPVPIALMVIWTVFSGIDYVRNAWPLLRGSWVPRVMPKSTTEAPREAAKEPHA